jgi:hypothetical protein
MLANFLNIRTKRPREAESADARLNIRRQDPDAQNRKSKDTPDEDGSSFALEEDSATVSLEALQNFLDGFLASQTTLESAPAATYSKPNIPAGLAATPLRTGPYTAQTRAYQMAARTSAIKIPQAPPRPAPLTQKARLPVHELQALLQLRVDLRLLALQGVTVLTIERGESFVQSLITAAAKAKIQ